VLTEILERQIASSQEYAQIVLKFLYVMGKNDARYAWIVKG
jgi:hypothetical protein